MLVPSCFTPDYRVTARRKKEWTKYDAHDGGSVQGFDRAREIHFWDRTGMIFGSYVVVFHGADASDAPKCVALQSYT